LSGPVAPAHAVAGDCGRRATLPRRLGSLVYESLLQVALVLVTGFALVPLVSPSAGPATSLQLPPAAGRWISFGGIVATTLLYCVWCWSRGRRTLPMKTWHLRLVTATGGPVGVARALARYVACWIGPALAGIVYLALDARGLGAHGGWLVALNFLWAFIDPERQFLHDRIAGTRIVDAAPASAGRTSAPG
jgi:uncharacterized RDD family membrane protein YckC